MFEPSRVIWAGGEPYLKRWHLLPRNRFFNIYLHHVLKSDDERALHDHPWPSLSFKLKGQLEELYVAKSGAPTWRRIPWLWPVPRPARFSHRLIVPPGCSAWTLFLTGPRIRRWGFWCPAGWKYWRDFDRDGGCGELT